MNRCRKGKTRVTVILQGPMRRALGVTAMRGSDFDPDGSYTGVPACNLYEKPVQDADDL